MFDVGGSGIKFALADIDLLQNNIQELHYYAKTPIDYDIHSQKDLKSKFPIDALEKTINTINHYKNDSRTNFSDIRDIEFYGTARYPFNVPDVNINNFLDAVHAETSVKIKLLDNTQEANIAYDSIVASIGGQAQNIIAWDINPQNITLVTKNHDQYITLKSNLSYVEFFNLMKKEMGGSESIYPMSSQQVKKAIEIALNSFNFDRHIESQFKKYIESQYKVIGRGFIHNHMIQHYVNLNEMCKNLVDSIHRIDAFHYSLSQVRQVLDLFISRTEKNIVSIIHEKNKTLDYDKEIIILILINALMHKLGIKTVHTINSKNIFGLLLQKAI